MTNIALVGCAHIHTPGFVKRLRERSDITVKAIWDHDVTRAEKYSQDLHAPAVADVEAIWEDTAVTAAIICSETNRHEELVLAGAAAGKHLFVEKPLGLGAADAYNMATAVEQAGVLFQTGYFMRSEPIHRFLRQQLLQGHFGTVTRVRHSNCHSGALGDWFGTQWRWMADPSIAGFGGFGDLGTHSLDILMWLMGDVARVTADIGAVTGRYGDCDEFGEGLLHFANGTVGTLAAGWLDVANPVTLIVSGTEGHAHVVNGQLYFKSEHVEGAGGEGPWTGLPAAWPHAFDLFLDAITGAEPPTGEAQVPLVTVKEAAARSAVMEALYTAAGQQTWVATA
jgi:predicted dehydrogenase